MKSVKQLFLHNSSTINKSFAHTHKDKKEEEMSGTTRSEDISLTVKMNRVFLFQIWN